MRSLEQPKKMNPIFVLAHAFDNYRQNGVPELNTDQSVAYLREQLMEGNTQDNTYMLCMEVSWDNQWHPYFIKYEFSGPGVIKVTGFFSKDLKYLLKPASDGFTLFKKNPVIGIYEQIPVPDDISVYVSKPQRKGFAIRIPGK